MNRFICRVDELDHAHQRGSVLSNPDLELMSSRVKQEIIPLAGQEPRQEGFGGIGEDKDEVKCRNVPQAEANEVEPVADDGNVQQDGDVAVEEAEAEGEDSGAAGAKGEHPAGNSSEMVVTDKDKSNGEGERETGGGRVDHRHDDELVAAEAGEDPCRGAPATGVWAGGSNDGGNEDIAALGSEAGPAGGVEVRAERGHEQVDVGAIVVAPVAAMRAPGVPDAAVAVAVDDNDDDNDNDNDDVGEHPSPLRHSSPRGRGGRGEGGGGGGGGGGYLQNVVSTPPRPEGRGGVSTSKSLSPSSGGADDQSEELVACQTPPRIEGRPSSSHTASAPLCESAGSDGATGGELGMSEAWNARLQCSTSVDTLSKEGRLVDLQSPAAPAAAAPSPPRAGAAGSRHSWDEIPINKLGMPMQQVLGCQPRQCMPNT